MECTKGAQNESIQIIGIGLLGTTAYTTIVFFSGQGFTAYMVPANGPGHFYQNADPTTVTFTPDGGQVTGDATERVQSGTAHTLHVTGDVTCGTTRGP